MTFALYLLLIALTMLHPIEAFAPQLAPYKPILLLSVLVLLLVIVEAVRTREMAARPRHLILMGLFVVTIALSLLRRGYNGGAVNALVEFSAPAILWILTILLITTIRRLKATAAVLAACMALLSVATIAAFHKGFMVQELVVREATDVEDHLEAPSTSDSVLVPAEDTSGQNRWRVRSWGFLSDPNDFSQAIVMVLPMLVGGWVRRRRLRNLLRIWIPGAVLLYAAYLTHSRGALLGLGAVLLFGMASRIGRVKAILLVMAFAFAATFVGFTGGRAYTSKEDSAGGRIEAWSEGLQMLREHPLTGVGYGNFTENLPHTAHNSFVLCFAELGLLGYFLWIAMLVLAFKETTRAMTLAPEGSDERRWAGLLRISMLGFLTCALFLSRTYQPTLYLLLAMCIASWHCALRAAPAGAGFAEPSVPWVGTTFRVMAIILVLVYVIVRLQYAFVR